MRNQILNVKSLIFLFVTVLLTYGVQGLSYGQVCNVGDVIAPGESCTYPGSDATFSVLDDGRAQWNIPGLPWWLAWLNQASIEGSLNVSTTVDGVLYKFGASEQADGTWLIEVVGDGGTTPPPPAQKPDLVVEQPTVSKSTLTPGENFTLSAAVKNQGAGSAAATTLRYYRSTDATISTSDTLVGTDNVSGLGASQSSTASISLTVPTSAGTYYYGACVEAVTDESSSDNNCSDAVSITVQHLESDLVVEQLTVSKRTLTPSENFTLSATVTNEGTGSAAATTLRYYRSTDATISTSDTEVGTDSVSGLGADESSAASITLTAPTSAGTYYYGACVEAVTDESSSDNNCSDAVSITVQQSTQPTGQTTYSIGEDIPTLPTGSWSPDTVLGGGGGARVVISGGTTIVTFGNGGAIIDDGITYTCVAAGGCTVEGIRVTQGTIQASGDGSPPPPAQTPNLVVESVQAQPSTVTPGQRFRLYATLRNSGTGQSAATIVRYYRSTDNIISTDDTQLGTGRRNPLAANASIRRFLNVTAPTAPGTYYYGVCVDSVPNESDTANNCSAAVSVIVQQPAQRPDLVIESVQAEPSTVDPGQEFRLSATLRNSGTVQSAATIVRYYRSTDNIISTEDTQLGTGSRNPLAVNATIRRHLTITAPTTAGTYYYGVCVDSVPNESDTANNCSAAVSVIVQRPVPDLVVEQPTVSKDTLTPGENFTLSVTVKNQGAGNAAATMLRYYRSTDATISTSDTEVGTDNVNGLGANQSSAETITLTAPTPTGTYYYGACVEAVTGESRSDNNCSVAVTITITPTQPVGETTYNVGDDIPTLPTGFWFPDAVLGVGGGAEFVFSEGEATITFGDGGTIIEDGITYTCVAAGGCAVEGIRVTQGTIRASGGGSPTQTPDSVVEQPTGIEDGTPLSISTTASLIEATLHRSVVTLTLNGGTYAHSRIDISNALTVSGIDGVRIATSGPAWFGVDRVSDTEITVELGFEGNINTDATLTFTVGASAIAQYNGPELTVQVPVTAVTESVVASTAAPLTETTLHESVVTLTLNGGTYVRSKIDIGNALTVSGIDGVRIATFGPAWFGVDRVSDTEITVELGFEGNINTDATLTFTVGASAIAQYNGPELTVQVPVTAVTESVVASTAAPLTETTLHESVVTLTLNGGTYVRSKIDIGNALTVSGIDGVRIATFGPAWFGVDRVSDTEITVELGFEGNINTDATLTFTVGASAIAQYNGPELTARVSVTAVRAVAFNLSLPAGISLVHVPLKVTTVDGVTKTIESVGDLYDALGGAGIVNFLITYDSQTQEWRSFFVPLDKGTPANAPLADDTGIIVSLRVAVSLHLSGDPLGTDGSSTITLKQDLNLVGLPLRDSKIARVSDLLTLERIGGNVPVIIVPDGGKFKLVRRAGDPGDIEITGGQAFIMSTSREATVDISGAGWTSVSGTAAAPSMAMTGIEVDDVTPILALRGSIVGEDRRLNNTNFRVIVKNRSTGRSVATAAGREHHSHSNMWGSDGVGYQLTDVDLETARAARIGDVLEISAQSSQPLIGVKPLQYTVTAEDVRQGWIQLPSLVAHEIPSETQLLRNYPNPFNPETWIPYHLSNDSDVSLSIYDINGALVRELDLGHQRAGYYTDRSRAAYWDGRNAWGEQVASGIYFYQLRTDDYSQMRKMVIVK